MVNWGQFGVSLTPTGLTAGFTGGRGRRFTPTEFVFALSRFVNQVQDWGPAWDLLIEDFQRTMAEQFESEGSRLSGGWAPLDALYYFWKEERYPGQPILSLTGALKQAATNPKVKKGKKTLQITIDDPKFQWHQVGTDRMPARPILAFPQDLQMQWAKVFHAFVVQCARRTL